MRHIKGLQVKAVDATAAGDAFAGALAVAYMRTGDLFQAANYANFVGALTVTELGAQTSLPTQKQVTDFICKTAGKKRTLRSID